MATSKTLIYFIQRRHLLSCTGSMSFTKTNLYFPFCVPQATFADQKIITKSEQNESGSQLRVGFAEKVKENTKSAWYLSVIIAGIGITGVMFYAIFRELFSSKSPNSVHSKAFERCINDPKVIDSLGSPIKSFDEMKRRGRGNISHVVYEKDGINYMKMKFLIRGSRQRATVNLEMKEDEKGDWVYRYLFVQLKDMSRSVIILEDNRSGENVIYKTPEETHELIPSEFKQ